MSQREPGRNDPCPCNSGKKYKHCHGKPSQSLSGNDAFDRLFGAAAKVGFGRHSPSTNGRDEFHKLFEAAAKSGGMVVEDRIRKTKSVLGGPGVIVALPLETHGDLSSVLANPKDYLAILRVDLPFLIPISDENYSISIDGENLNVRHDIRHRGQEEFSSLNTSELASFSHLTIEMTPFADHPVKSDIPVAEGAFPEHFRSFVFIIAVLRKFEAFLQISTKSKFLDGWVPKLSYRILYVAKAAREHPLAESVYVTSGTVAPPKLERLPQEVEDELKSFLSASVKITSFAEANLSVAAANKGFREKVFLALHDFCFYCSQHSRAIRGLVEEHVRDLFLVVIKSIVGGGEGEVFHFDGKLDYKISNPENKYEFISGEFKWWSGEDSVREVFHQAVRKHSTGQEAEIHIVMLSRNKDVAKVCDDLYSFLESEEELDKNSKREPDIPKGSKERFLAYDVETRKGKVPLIVGLADCYYQNV